jgi:hypothetical protein
MGHWIGEYDKAVSLRSLNCSKRIVESLCTTPSTGAPVARMGTAVSFIRSRPAISGASGLECEGERELCRRPAHPSWRQGFAEILKLWVA